MADDEHADPWQHPLVQAEFAVQALRRAERFRNELYESLRRASNQPSPEVEQEVELVLAVIEQREARQRRRAETLPKRRHRPPDEVPEDTVRGCVEELHKRERAGRPKSGPLTLGAIAERVKLPRTRVKQFEELVEVGWSPLRTHPHFVAAPGYVRLPQPSEAASLLRSP